MRCKPTGLRCPSASAVRGAGWEGGDAPGAFPSRARALARRRTGWASAFTLAETLAALAFVSVVIPVAAHAVRVANLASQVAERRLVAAHVADRILNELVVTGRANMATSGNAEEGRHSFPWRSQAVAWERGTLREVSVLVTFTVQGNEHVARAATIVDSAQP
ncbi:MAG: hypothetical protein RL153_2500 [Verrucomicrobiota bacterium]